jgi:hypothetical protein
MAISFFRPLDRGQTLIKFPDALLLGVDEESILIDDEVWSARLE